MNIVGNAARTGTGSEGKGVVMENPDEDPNVTFIGCGVNMCFPSTPDYAQQYTDYWAYKANSNPAVGVRVDCWCPNDLTNCINPPCVFQCDGDADGAVYGARKYRVYTPDLTLLFNNWKKKIEDPTIDPCADFDHKPYGARKYRVYTPDLTILFNNWKAKDGDLPANCPRPD